jgi:hypothetical protein
MTTEKNNQFKMEEKMLGKGTFKSVLAVVVMSCVAVSSLMAFTLDVNVKDENDNGILGAQVVVTNFDLEGNPDPSKTSIKTTDTDGYATFELVDADTYKPYMFFVSTQGYAPTVREQFMGTNQDFTPVSGSGSETVTRNVTLESGLSGVAIVEAPIILPSGVAPAFIFGSVNLGSMEDEVAFGLR